MHFLRCFSACALLLAAAAVAAVLPPLPAAAQQPGGSPAAKANQCLGCHEIPGYKSVFPQVYPVPKIINQSAAFIETALKAYRSGARTHPSMNSVAAQLSDEDIRQLAQYYAAGAAKGAGAE